jgi:nicotinate phosphoribosyltransferase
MDNDFYTFTMGQVVHSDFPKVRTRFGFKNRTKVPLGKIIPEEELREELDHARTLRFTNTNLHYLRGTNEYGERMFKEPYLSFLREFHLPEYELEYRGDDFTLEFPGYWSETMHWEVPSLSIVNQLYFRQIMKKMSRFDCDRLYAEGIRRLHEKVKILKQNPQIIFTDFGTRRRHSYDWQDYVNGVLHEELSQEQFRGTSCVEFAQKYGSVPMGTNSHQMYMVIAGLLDKVGKLDDAQDTVLDHWEKHYGLGLSIFLPDTFGTDYFLRKLTPERAARWKGFRQDSGSPVKEGKDWIEYYTTHGINSAEKSMIPSDGQTLDTMLPIEKHFRGVLNVGFGWGSNLTNDLGLDALSIVVKPIEADGQKLVKLSNNPAKATGDATTIERYKKAFGYTGQKEVACTY